MATNQIPEPVKGLKFYRIISLKRSDGTVFFAKILSEVTKVDDWSIEFKSLEEANDEKTGAKFGGKDGGGAIMRKYWQSETGGPNERVEFLNQKI